MVNNYTQCTLKSVKYSWEENPHVCRTAATMAVYCLVQLVRWDMSYDLGWCSTHFSGEKLKVTAHVSANEL
jgi:hypothetical protein